MASFSLIDVTYQQALDMLTKAIDTQSPTTYTIDFKSDFVNAKIIRDFVGTLFERYKIIHPWKGRFVLVADEILNNAIEHGSNPGDINHCEVFATKKDGDFYIKITIEDVGKKKYQPEEILQKLQAIQEKAHNQKEVSLEKRGRGLFTITEKVVDSLSFASNNRGGITVTIDKLLPGVVS